MAKYTLKSKVLTKGKSMYHKWGVKNGLTYPENVALRGAKFDTFGGLYCTLGLTLRNQMIPDFPHNIRIRLAPLFFL